MVPARQPVDVIDKGVPLKAAQFVVINFPSLLGNQCVWIDDENGSTAIPHAKLENENWCIEMTGVPRFHTIVDSLRSEGSFGFTYNGAITRPDGTDFSVEDVKALLEALRLFLSFARGGYCSLALVEGKDENGDQSWVRWGSHNVAVMGSENSWLRTLGGDDILAELFPRFLSLLESGRGWRDTVARTIDWYLQSNESPPYVGLILTQAALERLSYQVLGRKRPQRMIEKGLEELQGMESSISIPPSCTELRSVGQWQSGPHALCDLRNDLVHPEQSLAGLSDLVYHEAWNLGQWYIEMMLLNKLGYRGSYRNRLASWNRRDEAIPHVPWVSHLPQS